jgi:hypothetical protein
MFLCRDRGTDCGVFVIFEVDVSVDVLNGFRPALNFGAGVMKNVGRDWGLGGIAELRLSALGAVGIKPRARRWLSDDVGIEMEVGLERYGADGYENGWGLTTGGRLNWNDRGLLMLRHDMALLRPVQRQGAEATIFAPNPPPRDLKHALALGAGAGSDVAGIGLATALGVGLVWAGWQCAHNVYPC